MSALKRCIYKIYIAFNEHSTDKVNRWNGYRDVDIKVPLPTFMRKNGRIDLTFEL